MTFVTETCRCGASASYALSANAGAWLREFREAHEVCRAASPAPPDDGPHMMFAGDKAELRGAGDRLQRAAGRLADWVTRRAFEAPLRDPVPLEVEQAANEARSASEDWTELRRLDAVTTDDPQPMTAVTVLGDVDARAVEQLRRCAEAGDAPLAAACADAHVGYSLCVGGVVGYRDQVSPSGVGYDIGCGNMAVRTDVHHDDVQGELPRIADEIAATVDFGMGVRPGNEAEHPVIERIREAPFVPQRALLQLAAAQLGTVGSGNHYVDLFADDDGRVWVGVHFGSRGFGHKTACGFLSLAAGGGFHDRPPPDKMDAGPTLLPIAGELGQSYIEAMELAGAYARAGREVVVDRVLGILGARALDTVHNHHNYAWREKHATPDGVEDLWVVRKGATPAFPGQRGFVGATMGEPAVILSGAALTDADVALAESMMWSTVHGAGRVMSRTEAAGKRRWRWTCLNRDCPWVQQPHTAKPAACPACGNVRLARRPVNEGGGKIDWPQVQATMARSRIELRGGGADEAPAAYKRLAEVLRFHSGTVDVEHLLWPLAVVMAGPDTRDEFKD